jgi:parvulin-like peptidyl-prolyl isomerase
LTEEVKEIKDTPRTAKKAKGGGLKMIIVLLVLLGVFFTLYTLGIFGGRDKNISEEVASDPDKVVASVIGTTITRADLDKKIEQIKLSLPEGSPDPTEDAAFEVQLLQDMIDLELLTAAAMDKNYTVTDDEVDAEIGLIIEQFNSEDEFYAELETVGLTKEELRENIKTEMHIRRLLDEETELSNVTASDEEISDLYELSVGDSEDAPPLVDVSEMIKSQILNQKSASIIDAYVTELRENAEIEINL